MSLCDRCIAIGIILDRLDGFHKISQQNHFISSPVPLALPDNDTGSAQWIMAKHAHYDHFLRILQITQVSYSDEKSILVYNLNFSILLKLLQFICK